jgi:RHS repeat-associated protein
LEVREQPEATDAAGFGLMYFNARWMDPWLGRFAQADTMIPGAGDPQAWDRYAFVNNNPVRYIDPSGHAFCQGYDGGCTGDGGGGGGGSLGDDWYNYQYVPERPPLTNVGPPESSAHGCPHGLISAIMTPDGSCGHVKVDWDAVVDPLAWEHIAGATLGGTVLTIFGGRIMIPIGARLCTSIAGCIAGISLIAAGLGGIGAGTGLIWSGFKFTEKYLKDIFILEFETGGAIP